MDFPQWVALVRVCEDAHADPCMRVCVCTQECTFCGDTDTPRQAAVRPRGRGGGALGKECSDPTRETTIQLFFLKTRGVSGICVSWYRHRGDPC